MHIVTSKTMAEQTCTRFLDRWIKLVSHRRSFSLGFSVLNFGFSLVATLGNLLVIRALMKTSTIPTTVKKLFLSLAFSDLAVGLCSQLMTAIISAVMLKMASSEDDVAFFCPTVLIVLLYFMHLLAVASFLNVIVIAFDRLLAVSLHLRYQELVTPIRVTIVLVSLWLTSCIAAFLYIFLPKGIEMAAGVFSVLGYVLTTMAYVRIYKVVKYHQNQIYSQNRLQNAQTREALRQRKSAYSSLFVCVLFLACYFPYFPCTILYTTNTTEISFHVAHFASVFLIYLNSSLNPIVYCWRYREIRQIVKSTMKKIPRLDENMTWGCDVLRDEIWRERAIVEGNWDELTFSKTSGSVTRDKGWRAPPHLSNSPRKNCGKYFGPNRFESGEWACCAQRPRTGFNLKIVLPKKI